MKFDFVIGNPPYQEENKDNGRQGPVYNKFMNAAYEISDCVEMITPARFLFNAGQTSNEWNKERLEDEHFKVLEYFPDASKVFPNTEIKGGVAITIRNTEKSYGKIGIFTEYDELNSILHKIIPFCDTCISDISIGAVPYKYTDILKEEHPEYVYLAGKSFDLRTNALDKLGEKIFFQNKPVDDGDYIQIAGLYNRKRQIMYVQHKYIDTPKNFTGYKVLMSKANGSGKFGEVLSQMIIAEPKTGHTQSFISVGNFKTRNEACNLEKYIKTKFARCLLSVLRTTQDTTPYKWKYVPLQDFTVNSDINWALSVSEIDKQLYRKYNFSEEEIAFIENNVKEMK